ncbi:protease Do-like 1, chloroplastic [Phragmites australis]|uniref:protease Do-like 1, chloroplastic n=1 Tax=Phragmites australis TaxID=29695 RepID=UPI002D7A2557|nr:protease Do-like 1, chloroplastic [Phragmites australis]
MPHIHSSPNPHSAGGRRGCAPSTPTPLPHHMAAASSSSTACFFSPCSPPRRPRHFLRHLACAASTKSAAAASRSRSLALPSSLSPLPWSRWPGELVPAEAGRLLSSVAGSLIVALASAALILGDAGAASAFVVATPRKLQADEVATVRLFQENTPSVVYITNLAVRQDAFTLDVLEVPQGSGSGFVWDKNGHVVTNFHVIRGASDLRVTLADQSVYEAQVVGFDQDKDVAVLRIKAPKDKLRPIPVGVSADLLVGQKVYAIGNPFGLDHTLTTGVISGLRREISSAATGRPIQDVIQTDAAINPGNSGGPLLDSSGNLIGVNTAIYSPSGASSGVGFSIPVDTVGGIVDQLIKFGKVTRPILGIKFAPDQSVEQLGLSGVLVLDAPPNGPAGKAGLQSTKRDAYGRLILGDIITSMNGTKITNGSDLYRILDQCKVGETVTVEVLRGDHKEKIPVILEPKPDES